MAHRNAQLCKYVICKRNHELNFYIMQQERNLATKNQKPSNHMQIEIKPQQKSVFSDSERH